MNFKYNSFLLVKVSKKSKDRNEEAIVQPCNSDMRDSPHMADKNLSDSYQSKAT